MIRPIKVDSTLLNMIFPDEIANVWINTFNAKILYSKIPFVDKARSKSGKLQNKMYNWFMDRIWKDGSENFKKDLTLCLICPIESDVELHEVPAFQLLGQLQHHFHLLFFQILMDLLLYFH